MSTDRDPLWDALKAHSKSKFDTDRATFLADAKDRDDGGWVKHTEHHWSRTVAGKRLDYWPSRKKWQFDGRVQRGDVIEFIKSKEVVHEQVQPIAVEVQKPAATITSWTNGSYWRNYKVEFHRNDLPEGTKLYTEPSKALALLDEVAAVFTRDDELPNNLLQRIDALLLANR